MLTTKVQGECLLSILFLDFRNLNKQKSVHYRRYKELIKETLGSKRKIPRKILIFYENIGNTLAKMSQNSFAY